MSEVSLNHFDTVQFLLRDMPVKCRVPGVRYIEPHRPGDKPKMTVSGSALLVPRVTEYLEGIQQVGFVESWRAGYKAAHTGPFSCTVGRTHVPELEYLPEQAKSLRDYQYEGTRFMLHRQRAILGDQMGLGKTFQTICAAVAAVRYEEAYTGKRRPVVLLGPKILAREWQNELVKWGFLRDDNDERFYQCEGATPKVEMGLAEWIYCQYDLVRHWWSAICCYSPLVAVLDEAHIVKNSRSQQAKGARLAATGCPYVLALTGTPLVNRISDLHSIADLVTPWAFGTKSEFRMRYMGAQPGPYGGLEDREPQYQEELRTRLSHFFLRRETADVLEMPRLTRKAVSVPLTEKDAEKYAAILLEGSDPRQVLSDLNRGILHKDTLMWLNKLRKVCAHSKRKPVVQHMVSLLEQGESALLFAWQVKDVEFYAKMLEKAGFAVETITGDMSATKRTLALGNFRGLAGTDQPVALVATFGSLNVGVNLQQTRNVVFADLDWVPATLLQAEARVWRSGQTRPVNSTWFVAEDTLDEFLIRLLTRKSELVSTWIDDTDPETLTKQLSVGSLQAPTVEEWGNALVKGWQSRVERLVTGA